MENQSPVSEMTMGDEVASQVPLPGNAQPVGWEPPG